MGSTARLREEMQAAFATSRGDEFVRDMILDLAGRDRTVFNQQYRPACRNSALLEEALAVIDLDCMRAYGPVRSGIDHINRKPTLITS